VTEDVWDPDRYAEIRDEIPGYGELQEQAAKAAAGVDAHAILELGIGTGETTRGVLAHHPQARLTAIDSSPKMLERACETYPEADIRLSRLEDPLPPGPFDLVFSALAVHHLDGAGKRDLFGRIAASLADGGTFVLADVIVPVDSADAVTPCTPDFDLPDRLDDQLGWLADAGFDAEATWVRGDLAVVRAKRRPR